MDMAMAEGPYELADGVLATALTDGAGALCGYNPAFVERLGFAPRDLNGLPLARLFDAELRDEVGAVLARVLSGVPHHVTWPTRVGSGGRLHCEWQLAPRALHDGFGAAGVALTVVPVEDQRRQWRRLNENQERFRTIAAGVAAMVWVGTPGGAIRTSNRAWRDFLGGEYPSPDVWRIVLHPEDRADVHALRRGARVGGEPVIGTYRLRRHDGAWRWVEERVLRQATEDGEMLVASCNDITEQRAMREQLEDSIALNEAILNGAHDAIITADEGNRIVGFNPAAEQMFGRAAGEVIGRNAMELIPERFRTAPGLSAFTGGPRGGGHPGGPPGISGLRPDGSEFPIEASVSRVATPQGHRVTAIIRDMTSQMRALEALEERKDRLQMAIESANLGWAQIELASGRTTFSRGAAGLLGLGADPAAWVVNDVLQPVHPEDRGYVGGLIQKIILEDRPLDAEFRIVRADDRTERWLYGRGRLYRDAAGAPSRVVGVVMDISDRKHSEAQLRRLSRRLLAVQEDERRAIARELHDQIGQALTAAIINLQMMPLDLSAGPGLELRTTLADVLQGVRELSLNLRPSMLDSLGLEPALRWYLERQARLGRFEAALDCAQAGRLPAETETVIFRLVQEAMTNVLRHARARTVAVKVERSGAQAVLTVSDDGVGFDPAAVLARADAGGSFGVLGMRERAELAGGTLGIASRPGAGTTVTAVLPL
jgi:PAS domain S-box-containing protein